MSSHTLEDFGSRTLPYNWIRMRRNSFIQSTKNPSPKTGEGWSEGDLLLVNVRIYDAGCDALEYF